MFFQSTTSRKLRAVVEGDRVPLLIRQFLQPQLDAMMNMVSVFRFDLRDDGEPRLAINQRNNAAGARRAKHGIALEIANANSLLNHFGSIRNASSAGDFRLFSEAFTLAASSQKAFPVGAIVILLNPSVDGGGRDGTWQILVGGGFLFEFQAMRNLLR